MQINVKKWTQIFNAIYDKFKIIQDRDYISDFDKVVKQIEKKKQLFKEIKRE